MLAPGVPLPFHRRLPSSGHCVQGRTGGVARAQPHACRAAAVVLVRQRRAPAHPHALPHQVRVAAGVAAPCLASVLRLCRLCSTLCLARKHTSPSLSSPRPCTPPASSFVSQGLRLRGTIRVPPRLPARPQRPRHSPPSLPPRSLPGASAGRKGTCKGAKGQHSRQGARGAAGRGLEGQPAGARAA